RGLRLGGVRSPLAWGSGARAQAPDVAGAQPKAAPLARYVPREGLASYLEFDGLDAHQAAWGGSAAYRLLNETNLGPLIEDVLRQMIVMSQAPIQPADLIGSFKLFARQGMAVAVWGKDTQDLQMVTVIRGGGGPELRRLIEMATQGGRPVDAGAEKAGRAIHQGGDTSWWYEKDDFVVTTRPDTIIAVLDGKEPA